MKDNKKWKINVNVKRLKGDELKESLIKQAIGLGIIILVIVLIKKFF